ncbi:hypothetical protein LSTR_LSTR014729 [Laodelphax striatellus]|uniref:Uncharacterized protein n=1 Tax=Laodelphax striatellus TaxID=195883 RepID=A0A482XGK3_LAOST|nr:hypothetical protein LSTR_LSTR014729 [Laodelphax striatellus]
MRVARIMEILHNTTDIDIFSLGRELAAAERPTTKLKLEEGSSSGAMDKTVKIRAEEKQLKDVEQPSKTELSNLRERIEWTNGV